MEENTNKQTLITDLSYYSFHFLVIHWALQFPSACASPVCGLEGLPKSFSHITALYALDAWLLNNVDPQGPVLRFLMFGSFPVQSRYGRKTWRSKSPSALLIHARHAFLQYLQAANSGCVLSAPALRTSWLECQNCPELLGPQACAASLQLTNLRLQSEMGRHVFTQVEALSNSIIQAQPLS